VLAGQARAQLRQVIGQQVDELHHAGAARALGDVVALLLEHRQGVGDRHRALAQAEERVVVLGVADPDGVVRGQAELVQRRRQPAGLVDPGRQHHHRALVEDDLQLQALLAAVAHARRPVARVRHGTPLPADPRLTRVAAGGARVHQKFSGRTCSSHGNT
jgi:hypothetical protein